MSIERNNLAYDLSLFEVSPREEIRKNNVVHIPKKKLEANARVKIKPLSVLGVAFMFAISVMVIVTVVYGQVQLTEFTEQINNGTKQLEESQSVYTQLKVKADSKFSLRNVEEYAKQSLGMKKVEPYQIEYISLSEGDKAEINSASDDSNLLNKISSLLS